MTTQNSKTSKSQNSLISSSKQISNDIEMDMSTLINMKKELYLNIKKHYKCDCIDSFDCDSCSLSFNNLTANSYERELWEEKKLYLDFFIDYKHKYPCAIVKQKCRYIDMDSKFITFSLRYNMKEPSDEWSKDKEKVYFINKHKWLKQKLGNLKSTQRGRGIPTGKINKIWVLDLDFYIKEKDKIKYDPDNCLFTKTFGNINEYIKDNNIYCVKTISGGLHLYFSYDPEMKQTTCKELHIDTRNDGGYVVAPYTKINNYSYTIFNQGVIAECPPDLKSFVLKKVINKDKKVYKKITNNKVKVINPITEEVEEVDELDCDLSVYAFSFPDYTINRICKELPDKFFNDREYWVKFTTAMKTLDRQDIWLKWTDTRSYVNEEFEQYIPYDKDDGLWLITQWDYVGQHNKLFMVNHILNECNIKNARSMLDYYKYKSVPENSYNADEYINHTKLGITEEGYNITFFDEYENYCLVVQSDTGTGKTTEFKKYILQDKEDRKFLSIVSRISLGKEQVSVFKKSGIECMYHEEAKEIMEEHGLTSWKHFEGDNVVITIDSLMKTDCWEDYSGYILFLDEFNSLVEYLICCPLLNKTRIPIFILLKKILKQCDRIICTDADINEICLRYLNLMGIGFYYMINEYKHNNNIPAKEIFSYIKFIKEVNSHEKWIICCDSKSQAEVIAYIGDKQDYKLITSETTEHVNLDDHDRVLYSPKIIYGLDSCMVRPVFCYMKEHTISPVSMVQQLCRCRNITKLYYLFSHKHWSIYKYHDYEQVYQEIVDSNSYGNMEHGRIDFNGERINDKNTEYVELLSKYIYRKDCYDTNKFAHFIRIIKEKGFKIETTFGQTSISGLSDDTKQIKKIKECELKEMICNYLNTINTDNHKYDIIENKVYKECIQKAFPEWLLLIQEILKIDWNKLMKYKELFLVSQIKLPDHFAISLYFNKSVEEIENNLKYEKKDYECNKTTMMESKLLFIHKYRKICGLCENDYEDIQIRKPLPVDFIEKFKKEYKIVFDRCAVKKYPDFTEIKHAQQYLVKMYNNCFGIELIKKRKSTKKGKSITYYTFNKEVMDYHNEIYKYRHPDPIEEELGFLSSDEEE